MSQPEHDVIVIGGGPGGATAAAFLAASGHRVIVLEKEHFPRFHIGESLLPYNRRIFEELGVWDELQQQGYPRKFGAQFHLGNAEKHTKFVFSEGRFTHEPRAIQVERATFDHLLLKNAARKGAEVREGWTVRRFARETEGVVVDAVSDTGEVQELRASFLIDASGRGNLTGNQEGLREFHPRLKKVAVFAHFENVALDEGDRAGDTVIVRLENKWFWVIPISATKTSVGLVMDKQEYAADGRDPAKVFQATVEGSAAMRHHLADATPVSPFRTTTDFSYRNRRFVGERLVRVGDAAGFMDPIFSAGVYLAMHSARDAAKVVDSALRNRTDGATEFADYEKRFLGAMEFYWEMVENFYTRPFMEVFLEPRRRFHLPDAVNAVLAGELDGGWALKWRLRLFFWIVKLQARFPLVPRIKF